MDFWERFEELMTARMTAAFRFLSYVDVKTEDECWIWRGHILQTSAGPRGRFHFERRNQHAARVSYQLFHGPIAPGLLVCHTCDVGLCVNPKHHFLGSVQQNNLDKKLKGRAYRGGAKRPRLPRDMQEQIRIRLTAGDGPTKIAKVFGVTRQNVSYYARKLRCTTSVTC